MRSEQPYIGTYIDTMNTQSKRGKETVVFKVLDAEFRREEKSEGVVATCLVGPAEGLRREVDCQIGLSPRHVCYLGP